jgi:hypothetical protein
MKKQTIVFIYPNTELGLTSKTEFIDSIVATENSEIIQGIQTLPCTENMKTIVTNIGTIEQLQPQIVVFSNMLSLEALALYTTTLWKIYNEESHAMCGGFYILTYDNQEIVSRETARKELSREVHNYYGNIEVLVNDIPSLLEVLNLPVR